MCSGLGIFQLYGVDQGQWPLRLGTALLCGRGPLWGGLSVWPSYLWLVLTKKVLSHTTWFPASAWKQWWGSIWMKLRFLHYVIVQSFLHLIRAPFWLYLTYKCFKFCKWSTYWSIRHWEITPKWPIFTDVLLSVTRAEPHVSHTRTKVTISRCELVTQLSKIIQ